jgi:hypothetical protein
MLSKLRRIWAEAEKKKEIDLPILIAQHKAELEKMKSDDIEERYHILSCW